MTIAFAALIHRPSEVSVEALSHGFAVALAGWDVPAPKLTIAALRGLPGFSVAFYRSGAKARGATAFEEIDHVAELFEDELPPGLAVRDAASPGAVVFTLAYAEEARLDDGAKFFDGGFERHYVREGEDGLEVGRQTADEGEEDDVADDDEARVKAHRGSTFLSRELGVAVLPALIAALYEDGPSVPVRLVDPSFASIGRESRRLSEVLRRVPGRGAFAPPAAVAGVATPDVYAAFVGGYDFEDPTDPRDLYREISIGAITGALHFHRATDLARLDHDAAWARAASEGLFPLASLASGALGGENVVARHVAIGPDHDGLFVVDAAGSPSPAGPTLGELLRYLSLGFQPRDAVEEDLIGALMLRAQVRLGG